MAVKKVTADVDGVKKTYTLDVPDGATNDDIAEAITNYHDTGTPKVLTPPPPAMNQVPQPPGLAQPQPGQPQVGAGPRMLPQSLQWLFKGPNMAQQSFQQGGPQVPGMPSTPTVAGGMAGGLVGGPLGALLGAASGKMAETPMPTSPTEALLKAGDMAKAGTLAGGSQAAGEGIWSGTEKLLNLFRAGKALSQVGSEAAANSSSLSKQVVDNREQAAILRKMFQKDFAKTADGIEAAHNQKILDAQDALDLVNKRLQSEPTDLGKQLLQNRKQDLTSQIRELKTMGPSLPPPEQFPSYAKWQEAKNALAKAKMDKVAAVHQNKIAQIQAAQLPTKDILKALGIAGAGAGGALIGEQALKHLVP